MNIKTVKNVNLDLTLNGSSMGVYAVEKALDCMAVPS